MVGWRGVCGVKAFGVWGWPRRAGEDKECWDYGSLHTVQAWIAGTRAATQAVLGGTRRAPRDEVTSLFVGAGGGSGDARRWKRTKQV